MTSEATPEARLRTAGHALPETPAPLAVYVPAITAGRQVMTSGQLPMAGGQLSAEGRLGDTVTTDEGARCARQAVLNALAAVKSQIGELDAVERVLKMVVYVASEPAFTEQPAVANGASELLELAFGDRGRHVRAAVGVAALPRNAPVEVELTVEVRA